MDENLKLVKAQFSMDMAYANISSNFEEKGDQNHQVNEGTKSDSFVVDMQFFSHHLTEKDVDTASSIISLQRSFSNKGSLRCGEKKINPITAALDGSDTLEKPAVVMVGSTDHLINTQIHHQITIMNGSMSNRATESKFGGKRVSFRRSSPFWTVDPRRILFFFATLSSIGTILLIYFTLSIGKLVGGDNALD